MIKYMCIIFQAILGTQRHTSVAIPKPQSIGDKVHRQILQLAGPCIVIRQIQRNLNGCLSDTIRSK
jgi:hypothetical protein